MKALHVVQSASLSSRVLTAKLAVLRVLICAGVVLLSCRQSSAGELVVRLNNATRVNFVGAVDRWDADGNPVRSVDPKAKIQVPPVAAIAQQTGPGVWKFQQSAPGCYDLVILARERIRIEGFGYPPVLEFDPFTSHDQQVPATAREFITRHIAQARLYENKVTPLHFAGDDKSIRVLVQLLRDKPTSFDAQFGEPVATLRHEVWQYTNRDGAWSKEKRVRVFDRLLMAKRELRQWTWIWEPQLGDIQLSKDRVVVEYTLPKFSADAECRGLFPYYHLSQDWERSRRSRGRGLMADVRLASPFTTRSLAYASGYDCPLSRAVYADSTGNRHSGLRDLGTSSRSAIVVSPNSASIKAAALSRRWCSGQRRVPCDGSPNGHS